MPEEPMSDGLTGVSTTLLMALAGVGAALLPILGEHDGTKATTIVFALLGLVPWALVAGGVRLSPWLFCVLALVPGVLILVVGDNSGGMFPLMLALVYLVWSSPSLLPPLVIVAAGLVALVELTIDKGSAEDSGIIYFAGGLGISWMSGALLRRQEALTAQVRTMRDLEVERRAATERAHLAREVHDVVAHSLTVVMLNLTGARRALSSDPAGADAALARAEVVGRDSLDSIRQVMDLLREPAAAAAPATLRLAAVPRLVDGFRAAGLDVALTMPEVTPTMEPSGELVVYRVVQESLSNVLQHAPGASADVVLAADPVGLTITVRNGPAPTVAVANGGRRGLGTVGMAERARAVGGTFEAGADPMGGWLVTAWLPVLAPAVPHPQDDVADESAVGRPLRVVLVDDQQLVRAGIAFILSTEPGIDVASEAANGELGLVAVADHRPDVVLMDVRMPVLDGLAATQRIRDADGPPVVVLTTFDDDDVLWGAVEAGAAGFLLKDTSADDIIRAIRTVADGGSWIDPRVTPRLLRALRAGRPATPSGAVLDALSERELEVLTLVARGASNGEIAAELFVSERTVKGHVGSIFTKLGARDRAAAIVLAFDAGLVVPGARQP